MIEIGILDPHPVVRAGLHRLVAQHVDLRITGEATSMAEAMALVSGPEKPDVLVFDLPEAGQRGFDAMACLRARAPDVAILVFTAYAPEHYAIEALRQSARGYLNKDCEPNEIVDAVRTLSQGRRYFAASVTELLAHQASRRHSGAAHEQLSQREIEVFYKLARGETASGIAAALALSVKTVSTYRTRLLEKLSLSTNSDLTYYAVQNRLIS